MCPSLYFTTWHCFVVHSFSYSLTFAIIREYRPKYDAQNLSLIFFSVTLQVLSKDILNYCNSFYTDHSMLIENKMSKNKKKHPKCAKHFKTLITTSRDLMEGVVVAMDSRPVTLFQHGSVGRVVCAEWQMLDRRHRAHWPLSLEQTSASVLLIHTDASKVPSSPGSWQ